MCEEGVGLSMYVDGVSMCRKGWHVLSIKGSS